MAGLQPASSTDPRTPGLVMTRQMLGSISRGPPTMLIRM